MGEIDDIFAGKSKSKGKSKDIEDVAPKPVINSKKKKKKSKRVDITPSSTLQAEAIVGVKRKQPETVVDPSLAMEPRPKKKKEGRRAQQGLSKMENSDDERFRDSRGTGPRKRTEEGYAVYKEDELRMNLEGGDTPLCPFDCNCCF